MVWCEGLDGTHPPGPGRAGGWVWGEMVWPTFKF